jgi:hypothetical protein
MQKIHLCVFCHLSTCMIGLQMASDEFNVASLDLLLQEDNVVFVFSGPLSFINPFHVQ